MVSCAADDPAANAVESRDGEDWPKFLGPRGTGVSGETGLMDKWPNDGPPVLWDLEIGTGYSAPSVRGNQLVVHHRPKGSGEVIECLRADNGAPIWKQSYPSSFEDPYGYNNGPRCSPILTEDKCYTYGAGGNLTCVALGNGDKIWSRDVKAEFDLPNWFFGVGSTPILENGLIIALVGGQPNSGVVAFDADTGKTVWEAVGKETWDGAPTNGWTSKPTYAWTGIEQIVSYSSPIAATIHGKRHVLCLTRQGLVSLDPRDGSENFKYYFRPRVHESVNAARPVVIGDRIFLSAAYRLGSVMLSVNPEGNAVTEVWRSRKNMLNHWSTSIHVNGALYGFSGRHENQGEFRCISAETGDVLWQTTGYAGDVSQLRLDRKTGAFIDSQTGKPIVNPFFGRGSCIQIGDKFIVLGERGTLALVQIDPEKFIEISRTSYKQIHRPAWAAPVLSRKRLYLRCEDALLCLDLAKPK
jgi:outer membrane protein assembly factor BamB